MSISVLLASYKEALNLEKLLPLLKKELKDNDFEIVVIDTQIPLDNTKEVCNKNQVNYYNRSNGNNYGDAIRTGILKCEKDYILVMDADGSHSVNDISKFINDYEKYDLTIGSRYVKGGKTENPKILIMMSKVVNVCYSLVFKIKVKDVSNSFRLYKAKDLEALKLVCNNFDIVEEILIKLLLKNKDYKIREVPITFMKRNMGKSKRKLFIFCLTYAKTLYKLKKLTKTD